MGEDLNVLRRTETSEWTACRHGAPDRRTLGVASDDRHAAGVVQEFVERIGYDAVRLDSLRAGRLLEPGGPVFGAALRQADFALALRAEAA